MAYGNNYAKMISYDVRLGYTGTAWADMANTVEVQGGLDLSVNIEYNLTPNIKLFANGTDLLNTKLLRWGRYETPGFSISGGAAISW